MSEIRRKLVIVGDGACGKVRTPISQCGCYVEPLFLTLISLLQTCLLIVFSKGTFPEVRLFISSRARANIDCGRSCITTLREYAIPGIRAYRL